ncbi:hypothetical protein [Demequina sp.]|uniref:hypothetical protein n=1 Tax=Demequina sp. TaxID=2050685 RepID=UPI003D0AB435
MTRLQCYAGVVGMFVALGAIVGCTATETNGHEINSWSGTSLNDYQRKLAADGEVSDAELRDAYDHAAGCVKKDGWQVAVVSANSGGFSLTASYGVGDDANAAAAKTDECLAQWVGPLDQIYQASHLAQGAEREAQFEKWKSCMTSSGGRVDGVSLGQDQKAMMTALTADNGPYEEWDNAWALCVDKYYFTLWPDAAGSEG